MSKIKTRRFVVVAMVSMLMMSITVLAANKEASYTISGDTKVMGSAFIESGGFFKHTGNGSVSIVGKDSDSTIVNYRVDFGDSTTYTGRVGSGYKKYVVQKYGGYYSSVTTRAGSYEGNRNYFKIVVSD